MKRLVLLLVLLFVGIAAAQETTKREKTVDDPAYFRDAAKKAVLLCMERHPSDEFKKLDENEKQKRIDWALEMFAKTSPKIYFASAELIDSFEKKSFDEAKCKTEIKANIDLFKKHDVELPVIVLLYVDQFAKNELQGKELELGRRVIDVSASKLKKELEKAKLTKM